MVKFSFKEWEDKAKAKLRQYKIFQSSKIPYGGILRIVYLFLWSCVLNFVIELLSRHSLFAATGYLAGSAFVFLYNSFLIFATLTPMFLFKRRTFAAGILSLVWLALGIANGVVLSYRVTPFTAIDLTLVANAMTMFWSYFNMLELVLLIIGVIAGFVFFVFLWRKGKKFDRKITYKRNIVIVGLTVASILPVTNLALKTRVISNYFGNIAFAFQDYGFPYCFGASVFATGIKSPRGYSEEQIKNIIAEDVDDSYPEGEKQPNVIFVQLESFFDPKLVKYLNISEDPIPNYRKLLKNYSHGYLSVPSVGAGTANTEFEVLTGMSLRCFGPGEYPYKTILKETTCESMAFNLKQLGYGTHAIHNNTSGFYSRNTVFKNLGFDSFTSKEMMDIQEMTPTGGWSKDAILTGCIEDALNTTEGRDFVFTVSVQGHGGYPTEPVIEDPVITVDGQIEEGQRNAWEYYVNEIYEMDIFVGDLIKMLEERGEPTMLVLYGDHLPTMGLDDWDVANHSIYQTQYATWNNFDLPVVEKNVKSYQLSAQIFGELDIRVGTILKFQERRMNTKNYWLDLEALQYDILYGKRYAYDGENPYVQPKMRFGVKDVTIEEVELDQGKLYVKGENFTQKSRIMINDKEVSTVFIDNKTIMAEEIEMKKWDMVKVEQRASQGAVLFASRPVAYH